MKHSPDKPVVTTNWLYGVYAVTIFLSSFLVFQIQPLISKHILPWYGGSASVWLTAMMFFMVALTVGYVYALLFTWLPRKTAVVMHGTLLFGLLALLSNRLGFWPSPVTPDVSQFVASQVPFISVTALLVVSVGVPFVLLASSSTMLQHWYQSLSGREPFSLYAVGNTGSLLGLLSYPLVFERWFETVMQGWWWTAGVLLYIFISGVLLWHWWQVGKNSTTNTQRQEASITPPDQRDFWGWMWWTAIPVTTMLVGTSYISSHVATIPFLWVIPLALYLISFIVSFRFGGATPLIFNITTTFLLVLMTVVLLITKVFSVPLIVFMLCLSMFSIFHLCHERLYLSRPTPYFLARFYVAISLGGVVASMVTLGAQLYVFTLPVELFILYGAVIIYTTKHLLRDAELAIWENRYLHHIIIAGVGLVFVMIFVNFYTLSRGNIVVERNFFGYKAVIEQSFNEGLSTKRTLVHGLTNHGYALSGDAATTTPLGYYAPTSGVAEAFATIRERRPDGLSVVVAGLGAGALAAYCEPGDNFLFFEIDPQVITMAEQLFVYLENCQGSEVIERDARLGITELPTDQTFDLIILDAYADDMMPIHLMTEEAVKLYQERLTPDGILAIHISSRYLNLERVIAGVALANDMVSYYYYDTNFGDYSLPSKWTVLVNQAVQFERLEPLEARSSIVWTDRYSSLLPTVIWSLR